MKTNDTAGARAEQFPSQAQAIWVNHATLSPWPRETMAAVQDYASKTHLQGPLVYSEWMKMANRLREAAATLISAESARDISLLHNTTTGINTLIGGLEWRPGDNVVTLHEDFPSNTLPWLHLQGRGVEIRRVNARAADRPEMELLSSLDDRTRVLAISSVNWIDGYRLRLDELGRACRDAGIIFFVDAIQHLGALKLDVVREQVDIVCAGTHKWLLGPEGMGLFYCRDAVRAHLQPAQLGWHMLQDRMAFEQPDRAIATDGRRFEPGTPNRLGQVAMLASLEVLLKAGTDTVESAILAHSGHLMTGLDAIKRVELMSDREPARRSGIVNFQVNAGQRARVLSRLREQNVYAIARGDGIRLSPHFYQGQDDMNRVLEIIERSI